MWNMQIYWQKIENMQDIKIKWYLFALAEQIIITFAIEIELLT